MLRWVQNDGPRRGAGALARRLLPIALGAALVACSMATAASPVTPEGPSPAGRPVGLGTIDDPGILGTEFQLRLVRRTSLQLESIAAAGAIRMPGRTFDEDALYEELTDVVRRGAERATRRAVKEYLIGVTGIEGRLGRARENREAMVARPERFDYQLNLLRTRPSVGLSYATGAGKFGLKLGSSKTLQLGWQARSSDQVSVTLRYNANGEWAIGGNIRF